MYIIIFTFTLLSSLFLILYTISPNDHSNTLDNPSNLFGVADNPNVYLQLVFNNALEKVSAPK